MMRKWYVVFLGDIRCCWTVADGLKVEKDKDKELFPEGQFDVNAQQIDLRDKNSWLLKLEEVSTTELVEGTSDTSRQKYRG